MVRFQQGAGLGAGFSHLSYKVCGCCYCCEEVALQLIVNIF